MLLLKAKNLQTLFFLTEVHNNFRNKVLFLISFFLLLFFLKGVDFLIFFLQMIFFLKSVNETESFRLEQWILNEANSVSCASCSVKKYVPHYNALGWNNFWRSILVLYSFAFTCIKLDKSRLQDVYSSCIPTRMLAQKSLTNFHRLHFCHHANFIASCGVDSGPGNRTQVPPISNVRCYPCYMKVMSLSSISLL